MTKKNDKFMDDGEGITIKASTPMSRIAARLKSAAPSQDKLNEIFDKLKKGMTVEVAFKGGMVSADKHERVVGRKSHSKKYDVTSYVLDRADGQKTDRRAALKIMRRNQTGRVSLAVGDMAVTLEHLSIAGQTRSGSRYFVRQPDGDYVFRASRNGGGYVHAVITAEPGVKQVKVTQPPEVDWELLADGLPHHIDLHKAEMEAQRMYERKGYWFLPMEKPNVYAMMTIRSKGPMDRRAAVYEKTYAYSDLKKALSEGESALKALIAGESPRVRDLKRTR